MRFNFDENADPRWRIPLEEAGHHVSTVAEEHLQGAKDPVIARTCRDLGLCLVTADVGFAQILEYPPRDYPGIIVLRHPRPTLAGMSQLVRQVAAALETRSPQGRLWIVEPGRIRIHGIPHDQDALSQWPRLMKSGHESPFHI
jgi:predicted nuclease of predicted toxin-antitoxin system